LFLKSLLLGSLHFSTNSFVSFLDIHNQKNGGFVGFDSIELVPFNQKEL